MGINQHLIADALSTLMQFCTVNRNMEDVFNPASSTSFSHSFFLSAKNDWETGREQKGVSGSWYREEFDCPSSLVNYLSFYFCAGHWGVFNLFLEYSHLKKHAVNTTDSSIWKALLSVNYMYIHDAKLK